MTVDDPAALRMAVGRLEALATDLDKRGFAVRVLATGSKLRMFERGIPARSVLVQTCC
jgi:hypothetical protein